MLDPTRNAFTGTTFDPCPGSSIKKIFVDWGDGTSYFYFPPPKQTSHTFAGASQEDICITTFCNDGTSSPAACHCFSNQHRRQRLHPEHRKLDPVA